MMVRSMALMVSVALFGTAVAVAQTGPVAGGAAVGKPAAATGASSAAAGADTATQALFETTCSGCHDINQATSQSNDQAGWKAVIETMVGYGAQVSPADQDRLAKYLAATHGPAATPKS